MIDPRLEPFKKDLIDLLNKHEASITFMYSDCSDTYGLCYEAIGVEFLNPLKEGGNFRAWSEEIMLANGYSVTAKDMEAE